MKLRIVSVDMYGYCGRDFHPAKSDEGLIVTAVQLSSFFFSETIGHEPVVSEDGRLYQDALPFLTGFEDSEGESGIESMWTVVTSDGRVLELMDHEVEPVLEQN